MRAQDSCGRDFTVTRDVEQAPAQVVVALENQLAHRRLAFHCGHAHQM